MREMKSFLSLLLAFALVFGLAAPVGAVTGQSAPELVVTPNVGSIDVGTGTANVVYTISIKPNGNKIGAIGFYLSAPEGMTLATNKLSNGYSNQGGEGYWLAIKDMKLAENEDTGARVGIFESFDYTADSGYFTAYGTTETRRLETEAIFMTIQATVDISTVKTYALGIENFVVGEDGDTDLNGICTVTELKIVKDAESDDSVGGENTSNEVTETPETTITPGANPFADISRSDWFYDAAMYVYKNGLMTGMTANTFAPNGTMTRAMVWTVLGRMAGETFRGSGANWYSEAQSWAIEAGVSDGTNPNGAISRQELVTMLWRFVGQPEADAAGLNIYRDRSDVASWATQSMAWAVENAIIQGTNQNLNPGGTALRCQVAAILMRYCEN